MTQRPPLVYNAATGGYESLPPGDALALPGSLPFASLAAAAAAIIPAGLSAIFLEGYYAAGDCPISTYVPASAGAGPGKFQSADGQWWVISGREFVHEQFGARAAGPPDAGNDDSGAIQTLLNFLAANGGRAAATPGKTYPIRYPLCVLGSKVVLDNTGAELLSDMARTGRSYGPIVQLGNSREFNLTTINALRAAGTLTGTFVNAGYTDTPINTFPGITSPYLVAFDCEYTGGLLAYYDDVAVTGNDAVQHSNAARCKSYGYRTRNAAEAFQFGSDTTPNTPYALDCTAYDIVVEVTNQAHTYYGAGFHGYQKNCWAWNVQVIKGCVDGTPDGNMWSASFGQGGGIMDSGGDCGRGANGQGFLTGANAINVKVLGCYVTRAKQAFADEAPLTVTSTQGNQIANCVADDVDYLMSLASHHALFSNVRGSNVQVAEILAVNVNGAQNRLVACDNARIVEPAGQAAGWTVSNNQIEGRSGQRQVVIRPWEYINILDATATKIQQQGAHSVLLNAFTGTLTMRVPISEISGFTRISDAKVFGNINTGGMSAGSSVTWSIIQTGSAPTTGNTSTADVTIFGPTTITPPSNTTFDFTIEYASAIPALGLADYTSDLWIVITYTNPTNASAIKDGTVTGYPA